jgi:hypothetical protein
MGYKLVRFENKGKTAKFDCASTAERLGSLGFLRVIVSLPMLVQQSRALYRTNAAKVKRQTETNWFSLSQPE